MNVQLHDLIITRHKIASYNKLLSYSIFAEGVF